MAGVFSGISCATKSRVTSFHVPKRQTALSIPAWKTHRSIQRMATHRFAHPDMYCGVVGGRGEGGVLAGLMPHLSETKSPVAITNSDGTDASLRQT